MVAIFINASNNSNIMSECSIDNCQESLKENLHTIFACKLFRSFIATFYEGKNELLYEKSKKVMSITAIFAKRFGAGIYSVLNISRSSLRSAMRHEFSSERFLFQTCYAS